MSDDTFTDRDSLRIAQIYADARYIEGYLSTAYSDDDHIQEWASNHADDIRRLLADEHRDGS